MKFIETTTAPFRVKKKDKNWKRFWYKYGLDIEGHLTTLLKSKWLESLKAVTVDEYEHVSVILPKTPKDPCLYELYSNQLDAYEELVEKKKLGSFRTKRKKPNAETKL